MKPPLTTEARPEIDPRYRSLCESLFDLLTGLRHEEAARLVYQFVQSENQVLTEALEEAQKRDKILTDAMCEVKATIEGRSTQPIADIVAGCQKELCSL